jgi:hypothetical protein
MVVVWELLWGKKCVVVVVLWWLDGGFFVGLYKNGL